MANSSHLPVAGLAGSAPLHVVVRFTTSIPDLYLNVEDPNKTTVVSLKYQIRSKLEAPTSRCRLRLIYGGKILQDTSILSSVLKVPAPPPRDDPKGKGKAVEVQPRVYVNCSIGDPLTEEELDAEASAALAHKGVDSDSSRSSLEKELHSAPAVSTTAAPTGFDRLLSAGFTPAEVGQLRLQFLSIRSAAYTPDTMPSPTTMRRLEDEWIDDNGATARGGTSTVETDVAAGAIDDLIWGLVIGFMWPLGAMGWLVREQGVWSARRQTAVWSGFMLSLVFGLMKLLG